MNKPTKLQTNLLHFGALCLSFFNASAQQIDGKSGPGYVPNRTVTELQRNRYKLAVKQNSRATAVALPTGGLCDLVANGNFETPKTASISGVYSNILSPIGNADELAKWQTANNSTPDYFSTSAPPGSLVYPSSSHAGGFNPYNNSHGSVGIFTWTATTLPYAEYIMQELPTGLRGDRKYYASMRVMGASLHQYVTSVGLDITVEDPRNHANNPYYNANGSGTYRFSGCGIPNSNYIQYNNGDWTLLAKVFDGKAGAKFLNIGNFNYDDQAMSNPDTQFASAYQYIDEVELYEIPVAGPSVACTNPNKSIGSGCEIPNARYSWSPTVGLSSPTSLVTTANPASTTTYTLTVILPNGLTSSSQTTVEVCSCSQAPGYIDGVMDFDAGRLTATIDPVPGATSYRWYKDGVLKNNVTGTGCSWIIPRGSCGNAEVSVEAYIPSCGYTPQQTRLFIGEFGSCRMASIVAAYPNPTADVLTVESGGLEGQALLHDSKGILRRKVVLRSQNARTYINLLDLPSGYYHLRIVRTGLPNVEKQIEVNH